LAENELERLIETFRDNPGTKDVVALDHGVERFEKGLQAWARVEG
jgi:hypothetical protein